MIDIEEFNKLELRIGTIIEASINEKARNPAYVLRIDFGNSIGIKKSSAQITALYNPGDLVGKQVVCCINLPPIHIGSITSEVRILGTKSKQGVVLIQPMENVDNGDKVF